MKKRIILTIILIAHSAILIKVLVFKDLPLIRIGSLRFNFGGTHEGAANFFPFKTILPYLLGDKGLMIAVINLKMGSHANENQTKKYDFQTFSFLSDLGVAPVTRLK